ADPSLSLPPGGAVWTDPTVGTSVGPAPVSYGANPALFGSVAKTRNLVAITDGTSNTIFLGQQYWQCNGKVCGYFCVYYYGGSASDPSGPGSYAAPMQHDWNRGSYWTLAPYGAFQDIYLPPIPFQVRPTPNTTCNYMVPQTPYSVMLTGMGDGSV